MNARRACGAALAACALVIASASALASGIPGPVLATVRGAERVTLVRLGAPKGGDPLTLPGETGAFCGREVRERWELPPAEAKWFVRAIGAASSYIDSAGAESMVQSSGPLVGLEFESRGAFTRVVAPASGAIFQFEYFNGLHWAIALTEQGRNRWAAAMERYLRHKRLAKADFDRVFDVGGAAPRPAVPALH